MLETLLEPFTYGFMWRAIWVCALVGGVCAFLSSYLMLKGWSLMGDALAHSVVPGVALAYLLALPYAIGAFIAGSLAAFSMAMVKQKTRLREDAIIGLIFTSFFALGLVLVSVNPTSVNIQAIILGNVLAITDEDTMQVVFISTVCLIILCLKWKDLMLIFFDEEHARAIGLRVIGLQVLFFALLSAACVAALQTVGACLVIAMVVTPGATAYLICDQFHRLLITATVMGAGTSAIGAYVSYFLDASPGGLIVTLQTLVFIGVFLFAPKYGLIRQKALAHG
ncbi:MAG: metal ABC transporter permease [Pseudomonadota bacterium]